MQAIQTAEQHNELGNSLKRAGKGAEAVEHYREALRLKPGWADVHNNLGLALRGLGDLNEALAAFRAALRARPDHPEARNNLGVTLSDLGKLVEAAASYRLVLKYRPEAADTHNNLGVVLVQMGRRADGVKHYRRALELRPNYAEAHNNLGNALRHEGKFEEAEASLREALRLRPEYAEAYNNLAIILVKQERVDEAIANYHQALRLKPEYPEAHKNVGLAHLGKGHLLAGWPEYEWRWRTKEMPARKFDRPAWDGGPLEGKTILLYAEQGLGDTLQFIRYAPVLAERGAKVVVECQKALLGISARCPGIERLVAAGDKLPEFDVHAALMSVPGLVGTELANIPTGGNGRLDFHYGGGRHGRIGNPAYITAEPERVRKWGEELKGITGYKIGIAWQGSKSYQDDQFRSIPLRFFEPVTRIAGTRLISLQKGYGSEQLSKQRKWNVLDFGNRLDEQGAFLDTAALMMHLDLVITSDTAIAHLAGALGVPVWLALSTAPDWRWLTGRDDSPWYPSMRLFRQPKRGDWAEVFESMARALEVQPALESAERYGQRGLALLNEGKTAEAVSTLRRALELEPKNAVWHNNLAVALDRQGKKDDALAEFRMAARLKPDYGDALHNLGNTLRRTNRMVEAEVEYRKALVVMPESADVCNHLGIALLWQAKHDEAEGCFRRALRLRPDHPEARNNLGVLLEQLGRIDESVACYEESLRINPDSPDTRKNLALGLLMRGDYPRGFVEYEVRWKSPGVQARNFAQPRWDGRFLDGQSILLIAEQGLGDVIQFVRYAPLVKQRGGVVLVECPGVLEKLLQRCPGIDRVIPAGAPLPDFAYQIPLLSLPAVFHTTLETVPAEMPYLSAEPGRIEKWGRELAAVLGHAGNVRHGGGIRIGIAWQGSQKYAGDAHRSLPLREFAPLAKLPGVQLISLQKGHGAEQLQELGKRWNIVDFGKRLDADGAFLDTAAILAHLDLVVTSDSAIAHLAGALGKPVWMAVSMAADWRWMRAGERSAWYPAMRLFRQRRWGDWGEVFERIAGALRPSQVVLPIVAEIAPGELLDKIAILEIKRERVCDEQKLDNIRTEFGGLVTARARCLPPSAELASLTAELKAVNEALWQIEDAKRLHEQRKDFGDPFVELARSVYLKNDARAALKRQINELLGARISEEKSFSRDVAA